MKNKKFMLFMLSILLLVISGCSISIGENQKECEVCQPSLVDSDSKYKEFISKFKETRTAHNTSSEVKQTLTINFVYSLFDTSKSLGQINIELDGSATIYFGNSELGKLYPEGYKVPEKVFYAKQVHYGNGGYYDIVFIKEDGHPLILDGMSLLQNKTINFKTAKNTNIINILGYSFTGQGGASRYFVVDIDGNVEELQY